MWWLNAFKTIIQFGSRWVIPVAVVGVGIQNKENIERVFEGAGETAESIGETAEKFRERAESPLMGSALLVIILLWLWNK